MLLNFKKLNFIGNGPYQKRRYETVPVSKSDRGSDSFPLKEFFYRDRQF